ncbi:MAG TPA: trigger factor [Pseudolabrys sp.]|uniref:trigger factor n=1 Tax=Pseudolabrys sp. TaxID=1960880 RepID=UPI002DDD7998|nr:trigger factor [Pseudolabrys sp.]HEV2630388.1 trigger factor [Pseudolabrys sp.]
MQVTETLSEGLKREYRVVVPAAELESKVSARLEQLKNQVRLNGFRPGKVPVDHLKRLYGRSTMAEVIEATVRDANNQIVSERGYKLAADPKVTLPEEKDDVEKLIEGKSDLDYTMALEIVPPITLGNFKDIKITKPVADVADSEVDEGIARIAEQNKPFAARAEGGKAEKGDRVVISYVGTINGEAFEGGTGEDAPVLIGSNTFIPGFEDQLVGIAAGESRTIKVTFPAHYQAEHLAGKDAEFAVTAKSVEAAGTVTVDDEFAKTLGLESLDKLREAVREQLGRDHTAATRQKVKRALLDELDKMHKFEPPPSLVDEEFNRVWHTVLQEMENERKTFADENTTEEKAKEEYRAIAERRVRLGLVLAEIGEKNNITVSEDELNRAIMERMRQFPGQEQRVYEYFRQNAQAVASMRAPIFEEKVVDFLLELAQVTDNKVSREELFKEDDTVPA